MDFKEYERRMQNPKYKELKVTTWKDNLGYVFISYRSNSWEKVLTEIVYRLQKEYHLRVYFDKDFSSSTNTWIDQFQDNMEHPNCKAFICFFDEAYVTSYATLLELMHAMGEKSGLKNQIYSVNFDINWDALEIGDDTGLGKESSDNPNAKRERLVFDEDFSLLKETDRYNDIRSFYNPILNRPLTVKLCKNIMKKLQPAVERKYSPTSEFFEQQIIAPLKKAGLDVFDEVPEKTKQTQQVTPAPAEAMPTPSPDATERAIVKSTETAQSTEQAGSITLIDFLKKYDNSTFKKSTYSKFRMVGSNGCERYTTKYYDSAFDLVWDVVMLLIREKGMDYIRCVNEKHGSLKNPVFISQSEYDQRSDQLKYRKVDVPGINPYYMYRHYGQFQWIDTVLKQRLTEFGLRLEDFSFEFVSRSEMPEANAQNLAQTCTMPTEQSGSTTNTAFSQTLEAQENSLANAFTYSLWEKQHTSKTLTGMMHDVFDLVAEKYPSNIPAIARDSRVSAVAFMQDVDEQKLPPNKLSYFRTKKPHSVGGEQYYVGTSYNREQGIAQLKKMLELCEGSANALKILSFPQKSTHGNQCVKQQIGAIGKI